MIQQSNSDDIITFYTAESYAIFHNIDKSILATNCFLEKFGYKFVCLNLKELENKFSALLSLPKGFRSKAKVHFQDSNLTITNEFWHALSNSHLFRHQILINKEVILLKAIKDFDQKVINNTLSLDVAMQHGEELQKFVTTLIQQIRLFKNGDIDCSTQFQISKEKRFITSKLEKPISKSYGHSTYTLTDSEAEILSKIFKINFTGNQLTELALSNFNLSYNITDIKTKYITLMTCLESLFNQGRDQITHTVSRHLALIISATETEFKDNYYQIKKLYKLRSAIVHGGTTNENVLKATDELQSLVRQAINYCLSLDLNKEQLFDKFNAFGFGKLK